MLSHALDSRAIFPSNLMFRDDSLIFSLVFFSTDEGLPTTLRVRVMGRFKKTRKRKRM